MKRIFSFVLFTVLVMGLFSACAKGEEKPAAFSVGFGQADIAPREKMTLAGYGNDAERVVTGVADPIYTTCVAIRGADGNTVLVFAADLLQANDGATEPVKELVSQETGIPISNIMFHVSHSHSSPSGSLTYYQFLAQQSLVAAQQALADLAPAQVHGAFEHIEEGINFVRHYLLTDGSYIGEGVGAVPEGQLYGHDTAPDRLLQVVKFTRENKKDILLVNFQGHPSSPDDKTKISSSYMGIMRQLVSQELDCSTMFILGASGNLNLSSKIPGEQVADGYMEGGKFLADKVIGLKDSFVPLNSGAVQLIEVQEPCQWLNNMNQKINVPLYALSFGDVAWIFGPHEMFDTNAMAVRDASPFAMTLVASCSNGYHTYIPTPHSFDFFAYEAGKTKYFPGTAEQLQDRYIEMLNTLSQQYTLTAKDPGYSTPNKYPICDGVAYTVPKPGDMTAYETVKNGYCKFFLLDGTNVKYFLAKDQQTAELVLQQTTVKLLLNESNIIVGIDS